MGSTGVVFSFFDLGARRKSFVNSSVLNRKLPFMFCRLVWVRPQTGLDRCVISRAQRDSIRQTIAIPTEPSRPML